MSAFKVRELTREIQGLPASAALDLLAFSSKKSAVFIGKTLKSAIANAENNNELKVDTLVVKEATVGEGPTMKRMKSRARGSSSQIRKRTSHIRIVLSDEIEIPQRTSPSSLQRKTLFSRSRASLAVKASKLSEDSKKKYNHKSDNIVPIKAYAKLKELPEHISGLRVGVEYVLEAGIKSNVTQLLGLASARQSRRCNEIAYDIIIDCDESDVKVLPFTYQTLVLSENRTEPVEFKICPLRYRDFHLNVNFIYKGIWAAKLRIPIRTNNEPK